MRCAHTGIRGLQPHEELRPFCSVNYGTIIAEGHPQRLGMLHHLEVVYLLQAGVNSRAGSTPDALAEIGSTPEQQLAAVHMR